MGKLHTLRRAIRREPLRFYYRYGDAKTAHPRPATVYGGKHTRIATHYGWWTRSHRQFVRAELEKMLAEGLLPPEITEISRR